MEKTTATTARSVHVPRPGFNIRACLFLRVFTAAQLETRADSAEATAAASRWDEPERHLHFRSWICDRGSVCLSHIRPGSKSLRCSDEKSSKPKINVTWEEGFKLLLQLATRGRYIWVPLLLVKQELSPNQTNDASCCSYLCRVAELPGLL